MVMDGGCGGQRPLWRASTSVAAHRPHDAIPRTGRHPRPLPPHNGTAAKDAPAVSGLGAAGWPLRPPAARRTAPPPVENAPPPRHAHRRTDRTPATAPNTRPQPTAPGPAPDTPPHSTTPTTAPDYPPHPTTPAAELTAGPQPRAPLARRATPSYPAPLTAPLCPPPPTRCQPARAAPGGLAVAAARRHRADGVRQRPGPVSMAVSAVCRTPRPTPAPVGHPHAPQRPPAHPPTHANYPPPCACLATDTPPTAAPLRPEPESPAAPVDTVDAR
ncbi:hypothetical protein BU14_0267s0004, partial [Porphyra umbilicalis]